MKKLFAVLFLLSVCISFSSSQGFDSTRTVTVTLTDETEITGKIIARDSVSTTVRSLSGVVSVIPNKKIHSITKQTGMVVNGEYYPQDPADNRLMLMPTARPLRSNEIQFNAVELFFPHLIIGATDYFSIGFGGLPFIASGGGTFVYYVSAKLSPLNFKTASVALGGAMIGVTESGSLTGVGYAVGTFGTKQASLTVGPFIAFSKDEVFDRPAFLLGGSVRMSRAATFITENILLFGTETEDFLGFPSIGIRFSGEHIAADFGTYAIISGDEFFYPIPWIGLSYKF
jgi:hypothetical protein